MKIKISSRSVVTSRTNRAEAAGVGTALRKGAGAVTDLVKRGASKVGKVAQEGAGKAGKMAKEGFESVKKGAGDAVDSVKKKFTKPTIKPDPVPVKKLTKRQEARKALRDRAKGGPRALIKKSDLVDLKNFAKLKGKEAINFMAAKLGPLADTPIKKLFWLSTGLAAIEVIPAAVKADKRIAEVKKNGGKPPAPYVNADAYIADAFPSTFYFRELGHNIVEMFGKSKQFQNVEGTLGKERADSLLERLKKRADKSPADSPSAAEGLNRLKIGYAAVEKAGMTVPSNVENKLKEGFAKTMEKQQGS